MDTCSLLLKPRVKLSGKAGKAAKALAASNEEQNVPRQVIKEVGVLDFRASLKPHWRYVDLMYYCSLFFIFLIFFLFFCLFLSLSIQKVFVSIGIARYFHCYLLVLLLLLLIYVLSELNQRKSFLENLLHSTFVCVDQQPIPMINLKMKLAGLF